MKKSYHLKGMLFVITVITITASGRSLRSQGNDADGNQNGNTIHSCIVDPTSLDAAGSEALLDPGPNLTALGQPASYTYDNSTKMLTINVRVINNGTTVAGFSYLGYYLSSNTTITTSDTYLGVDYVTSLAPGGYSNETITTDISAHVGTWYVGFIIDNGGHVAEDNENDNNWYFTPSITVTPPPLAPPNAPVLLSPLNGATGIPLEPILHWDSGGGGEPEKYWVEVYDALHNPVFSNSTLIKQQRVGPLLTNAMYSWKVYAENAAGDSPYSAEWSFTTSVTPVLPEEGSRIPGAFALKPPYPNPFNAVTKIAFNLPKSSSVRLAIYDPLGREIETLIDGPMAAGEYEVVWHAEGVTSGIYLCRMEADGFVVTRKLILQK